MTPLESATPVSRQQHLAEISRPIDALMYAFAIK
jgi:hypothetical protein